MTVDEILEALRGIIDNAEGRDLTDEEAARYEELEGKLTAARRSAELRARTAAYLTPVAPANRAGAAAVAPDDGAAAEHRAAFDGWVRQGQASAALAQYRAQAEATGAAGGFLVPDTFRARIVERMVQFGGFAEAAETLTTTGGEPISWPTLDDTANVGEIVQEGDTFTAGADVVFGTAVLGAWKYMAGGAGNLPLKVSWELLQDSAFNVEDLLTRIFGQRIGRIQAVHWLTGTGVNQPEGLFTPATAFDAIASNAVGPTYGELLGAIHALDPAYRQNAKWLMNDATLAVLRGMVDGNDRPLWLPPDAGMSGALPGGTLLGYPVIIDQAVPAIGDTTKFLAFGDFRAAYVIRRVKDVALVRLDERYAEFGQVGFMAWARADGAVQDPNAYVVLAGENTV
jgi:HK97 family phage major capsid protein